MLLLGSLLLLAVSIVLLMLALGLFTLKVWLKAIICLCEAQFIRGGLCLCLGIMLVNLFFGSGESYTSLYITIMILALAADIGKYLLWWRQRRAETAPGEDDDVASRPRISRHHAALIPARRTIPRRQSPLRVRDRGRE